MQQTATWDQLKLRGSGHYRAGIMQPIDLYRSAGAMVPFALCSIIKYAYRCLTRGIDRGDLEKIIHYAQLILALPAEEWPPAHAEENSKPTHPAGLCKDRELCSVTPGSVLCRGLAGQPPCPNWQGEV